MQLVCSASQERSCSRVIHAEFYLDAKEKKYIDECGAANFFGIKDNTYITPLSYFHPAFYHK